MAVIQRNRRYLKLAFPYDGIGFALWGVCHALRNPSHNTIPPFLLSDFNSRYKYDVMAGFYGCTKIAYLSIIYNFYSNSP
jgi:hypothetical protein